MPIDTRSSSHLLSFGWIRSPYLRRGEASFANCDVMSAKVTLSEVLTSITVGWRAASASRSAGASADGSSNPRPWQAGRPLRAPQMQTSRPGQEGSRPPQHPVGVFFVKDEGDDGDVLLD